MITAIHTAVSVQVSFLLFSSESPSIKHKTHAWPVNVNFLSGRHVNLLPPTRQTKPYVKVVPSIPSHSFKLQSQVILSISSHSFKLQSQFILQSQVPPSNFNIKSSFNPQSFFQTSISSYPSIPSHSFKLQSQIILQSQVILSIPSHSFKLQSQVILQFHVTSSNLSRPVNPK